MHECSKNILYDLKKKEELFSLPWQQIEILSHIIYLHTILDLFCDNGFLRAISHRRQDVRYNEKSISSITYQPLYAYQGIDEMMSVMSLLPHNKKKQ